MTTATTNNDQALEAKLHGVAAAFRRERDEAHRQRELANERLRLTREEADAAAKSLAAMRTKLDDLERASGEAAERQIERLKAEVESLTNQVRCPSLFVGLGSVISFREPEQNSPS